MKNHLEIERLEKSYGKNKVLKDISFHVPKKSIVGFIGDNGAGKSTTFKSILGLCQVDNGRIKIFGEQMSEENHEWKEKVGVVFDTLYLPNKLTIAQVNRIFSRVYKKWDEEIFFNYLNQFSLSDDLVIGKLSRGMSMKCSLAVALSHKAELLLLDEATGGLDPSSREEVLQILRKYLEKHQASILLSSHILEDVESIADRIVYIKNGKIILNEPKKESVKMMIEAAKKGVH